jgi:hypothetical protein
MSNSLFAHQQHMYNVPKVHKNDFFVENCEKI